MEKARYLEEMAEIQNQINDCRKLLESTIKTIESQLELLEEKLETIKKEYQEQIEYKKTDDNINDNLINKQEEIKTFKITNSFNPVEKWIDSFKKSDKWKNTIKWLIPNSLNAIAKKTNEIGGAL